MVLISTVSGSNWNLEMLVVVKGGKPEYPEKNPRGKNENQQQTEPTYGVIPDNKGLDFRYKTKLLSCNYSGSLTKLFPKKPGLICSCRILHDFNVQQNDSEIVQYNSFSP